MAVTPNYGLTKPVVGADTDAWGAMLNGDLDILDTELFKKSNANNPVFTGVVTAPAFVGNPSAILRPTVDGATAIQFQNAAGGLQAWIDTTSQALIVGGKVEVPLIVGGPASLVLRPKVDSATGFVFQNAAGASVVGIDTLTNAVAISGTIAAQVYKGGPSVILRPVFGDGALAINFQNSAGSSVGSINTTTGQLIISGSASAPFFTAVGGSAVLRAGVNGTGGVQLQNAAGNSVLTVDTLAGSVSIGTISGPPAAYAQLQLDSTSKGLLLNRLTTAQMDAILATTGAGTLIFNMDLQKLCVRTFAGWEKVTAVV